MWAPGRRVHREDKMRVRTCGDESVEGGEAKRVPGREDEGVERRGGCGEERESETLEMEFVTAPGEHFFIPQGGFSFVRR